MKGIDNITKLVFPKCHPFLEELLTEENRTKWSLYDFYSDFQVLSQVVNRQEINNEGVYLGVFNMEEYSRPVIIGGESYLFFKITSQKGIEYVSFSKEEKATEFNNRLLDLYELSKL